MNSRFWQGDVIWGMIRTLAVNCAPILDCKKDDGTTVAETPSDKMVTGAAQTLCEFTLLVSEQNHSDLFLTALDHALVQSYKKKSAIWRQNMLKSAKARVDEEVARESHQLQIERIDKIHTAMNVQVYGAEKVTRTECRQFQVCLNTALQTATKWSDADWESATERLDDEIQQGRPVKPKLFN